MSDRWRLMVTALALALTLAVAGCGDDEEEPAAGGGGEAATTQTQAQAAEEYPAESTMGKIQEKGEITIGVKYDVPPFGFKNPRTDQIEGFDIDFGKAVADKLGVKPKLVEAIYGITAPATPRNDLAEVFLTGICRTCGPIGAALGADLNSQKINKDAVASRFVASEMLRLNLGVPVTATPNRLGALGGDVQGYPNGRRLGDDVLDIELSVLEGALPPYSTGAKVGDGVDANDRAFSTTFPYVALPHDQAVNTQ